MSCITWKPFVLLNSLGLLTCQSFHPGGFIYTQVVNHNLHDATQQLVELLGGDGGAELALLLWEVLLASLPPAREVVTQHGQGNLNHMGHFCVAGTRLSQIMDLLHQDLQLWDIRAQLLHLVGKTQN